MARIRTIKPEFWEDEKIASFPFPCRLFFIGLWNFSDDQGVFRANPTILKSKIFPYDDNLRVSEVSKWLNALEEARLIIPIIHSGESYYIIRTFRNHQIIDKRYMKYIIPKDIADKKISTDSPHSEHIVNTPQEKEKERKGNNSPIVPPLDFSDDAIMSIAALKKTVFENEQAWYETIAMNQKLTPDGIVKWLNEFFVYMECTGETTKSMKDLKSHFYRWLKIQLAKDETKTTTESEPTVYRRKH